MIHCKLPKLFDTSLGPVGFPYHVAACVSLPFFLRCLHYVCAGLHDSMPFKSACVNLVYPTTVSFATNPLGLANQFSVARWVITRCYFGRGTRVSVLGITGMISTMGLDALLKFTADMA